MTHFFDYSALTDDIWCLPKSIGVLRHHIDCTRDFTSHPDRNEEERSEDNLETGQDHDDYDNYGPVD